jgi:hypothetical protein
MTELSIGERHYRVVAVEREGSWLAHAEQTDTGNRFGVECAGATEAEAVDRVTRWLDWQHEHTVALEALQSAERAYYRTLAGSAFVSPTEEPMALDLQKDSLEQVDAARTRLDELRARKPA